MAEKVSSSQIFGDEAVQSVGFAHETLKLKAAVGVAVAALALAAVVVVLGLYLKNDSLQAWATGLISSIAGAAIGYGFNGRKEH